MKSHSKYILALVCLLAAAMSYAIPSRPNPQRLVNDLADVFTSEQVSRLENTLVEFDDSTSNQIVVVTVKDLEGYDASEYATRIGLDWGVGSAQFNNGIVLLVKPKTFDSAGQVFIAVGYGLEGAIPDAYAKRIIENELIPNFRLNDYYAGVEAACDVLMKLASGEISEPRGDDEDPIFEIIMAVLIAGLLFFCFVIASIKIAVLFVVSYFIKGTLKIFAILPVANLMITTVPKFYIELYKEIAKGVMLEQYNTKK